MKSDSAALHIAAELFDARHRSEARPFVSTTPGACTTRCRGRAEDQLRGPRRCAPDGRLPLRRGPRTCDRPGVGILSASGTVRDARPRAASGVRPEREGLERGLRQRTGGVQPGDGVQRGRRTRQRARVGRQSRFAPTHIVRVLHVTRDGWRIRQAPSSALHQICGWLADQPEPARHAHVTTTQPPRRHTTAGLVVSGGDVSKRAHLLSTAARHAVPGPARGRDGANRVALRRRSRDPVADDRPIPTRAVRRVLCVPPDSARSEQREPR